MHPFLHDLRTAWRGLTRDPGFATLAVLTLAIGIGANTTMFSAWNAIWMTPLPYDQPDRLVIAQTTFDGSPNWTSSAQDYEDYRAQNDAFETFALMAGFSLSAAATGGEQAELVDTHWVSWDLFRALRVRPQLGRDFRVEDSKLEAADVVIVSNAYWQTHLGGSPEIIGTPLVLDGKSTTIVGVMPPGFRFFFDTDAWLPYRLDGPYAGGRQYHNWVPIGRLATGISLEQAQSQFDTISARLQARYPDTNASKAMLLTGLHESMVGSARPSALALTGAVVLLLLIACANVANLLLARSTSRQGELAIRAALGAARGRLVRQLLTESLLIALVAGAAGLGLALGLQRIVLQVVAVPALGEPRLGLNWPMSVFAIVVSMLTSLLFGTIPALRAAPLELSSRLRSGRRSGASGPGGLPGSLVVAQVALSLVLLVGAGLLTRSLMALLAVDSGFDPDHLLTAELRLPASEYEPAQRVQFFTELAQRAGALPGVTGVAVINQLPVRDPGNNIYVHDERKPPPSLERSPTAFSRIVLPGYFETMGIPLLEGRRIQESDTEGSPPVLVINQTMAETLFSGEPAIGRHVVIAGDPPKSFEVVGVVGDVRMSGPAVGPAMGMYRPYSQSASSTMRVAIRSSTDPTSLAEPLRALIRDLDPNLPVGDLRSMESVISSSETVLRSRVAARSLGLFALVALLLASVGLYGVLACFVAQRRHEIGVRMALGEDGRGITTRILQRGLGLVATGLAIGTGVALLGSRILADLLFEIALTDPSTYVGACLVFLVVAALACLVPAWRAVRVDPLVALRAE